MGSVVLHPRGPFSLASSAAFLGGFTPAAGSSESAGDRLFFAFRRDRTFEAVGAAVREVADGIEVEVVGTDPEGGAAQVARILSLDHDATGWVALGDRDPLVGGLQSADPGFRPPVFASPYEAAIWGLLAQRVPMRRAAGWKRALAVRWGSPVEVAGRTLHVAPHPEDLARIERLDGVPSVKLERLRALGRATLDGALDCGRLRTLPHDDAAAELQRLPGIGPWTAQHVLLRGTGAADGLPTAEPRVAEALRQALGRSAAPSAAEIGRIAAEWAPWRMWVFVSLVRDLRRGAMTGADRGSPRVDACGCAA